MTLPDAPDSPTAHEPVQQSAQSKPKRPTQRWVKIVWSLAGVLLLAGVGFSFTPAHVDLKGGGVDETFTCGTMWSHDTDDAVAFAKDWESKTYMRARSLGLSSAPDLSGAVKADCARALDGRSSALGWSVAGALALTAAGFVGRARPRIPVRVVNN